ncbi:putative thioredoxin-disulfide reductase [Dioscorea sansibarensis]
MLELSLFHQTSKPFLCLFFQPLSCTILHTSHISQMERVMDLASQRPVVIFSKSSCCMCYTVKTLFSDLGVNVAVYELDEDPKGREMEVVLARLISHTPLVPAVFIGGNLIGATDKVMALHLGGKLVPLLKKAGALWV